MPVFVFVENTPEGFLVRSPFDNDLPSRARQMGGDWKANLKAWYFPEEQRQAVETLYLETFGEGFDASEPQWMQLTLPDGIPASASRSLSFKVARVELARAWHRDSGASLREGILIKAGGFSGGGSKKNPMIEAIPGTILQMHLLSGFREPFRKDIR
jgi:hypothetical protein